MAKKSVTTTFDTELFKRSVLYNVRTLYRKTLDEATDQQIFQAVSYAIKDAVVDSGLRHRKSMTSKTLRWYITFPWSF